MRKLSSIIYYSVLCCILYSCQKEFAGEQNVNLAPETFTIIDTIIRIGDDRLTSQVTLNWWGNDADGFVTAFEYTFDAEITESTMWHFTDKVDSTFILAPEPGQDSANYVFHIRAIDNNGLKDPSPAVLIIPVKNSPPSVVFIPGINNPVKSFPVLKYFWSASDPDGENNVTAFELCFNDTTADAYTLDKYATSALFQAQDATADDFVCDVFINASPTPAAYPIQGLKANVWNVLYIRAVDQSGAKSAYTAADSVFVKKVSSTILLVDGYTVDSPVSFYSENLLANGFAIPDTIQIFEKIGGVYSQQSADNLTQEKVFALFDVIVWFSNDADNSFSLAQKTSSTFFSAGGKMFMSVYISSSFDPLSNFLDFTPIASLVDPVDTTLILDAGAVLTPFSTSYPSLAGTSIVGIVKPIILQPGATALYDASLTAKDDITITFSPWEGESTVIAKKTGSDGAVNFVIATLEMQKLNGLANMEDFFHEVFIDEFGL